MRARVRGHVRERDVLERAKARVMAHVTEHVKAHEAEHVPTVRVSVRDASDAVGAPNKDHNSEGWEVEVRKASLAVDRARHAVLNGTNHIVKVVIPVGDL